MSQEKGDANGPKMSRREKNERTRDALMMRDSGASVKEVAKHFNVTVSAVYKWFSNGGYDKPAHVQIVEGVVRPKESQNVRLVVLDAREDDNDRVVVRYRTVTFALSDEDRQLVVGTIRCLTNALNMLATSIHVDLNEQALEGAIVGVNPQILVSLKCVGEQVDRMVKLYPMLAELTAKGQGAQRIVDQVKSVGKMTADEVRSYGATMARRLRLMEEGLLG